MISVKTETQIHRQTPTQDADTQTQTHTDVVNAPSGCVRISSGLDASMSKGSETLATTTVFHLPLRSSRRRSAWDLGGETTTTTLRASLAEEAFSTAAAGADTTAPLRLEIWSFWSGGADDDSTSLLLSVVGSSGSPAIMPPPPPVTRTSATERGCACSE
jgi:hypothetical protein